MDTILSTIKDDFIRSVLEPCVLEMQAVGVKFFVSEEDTIPYDGDDDTPVHGYFAAQQGPTDSARFGISTKSNDWYTTFVHEYCHFKQWRASTKEWNNTYIDDGQKKIDAYECLANWSLDKISLTSNMLAKCCKAARDLELDAERMTVEFFKQNKLSVNTDEYTQKANSYILTYSLVPIFGNNYTTGTPYEIEAVWKSMPKTFDIDYDTVWHKYVGLYWEHCYK